MEQIIAMVDWCGKNYASYINDPRIGGLVISTGKTYEKLQQETEEGLRFHLEGCLADGDPIPEAIRNGNYELVYEKRMSAILHEAQQYTTLAALSRITGINERQLWHYAAGVHKPRRKQAEKIQRGIQSLTKELGSISLV